MLSKRAIRRKRLKTPFERWKTRGESSWAFQVYSAYNTELDRYLWAYIPSSSYTYSKLKSDGAVWEDSHTKHFKFPGIKRELFKNLKDWSKSYNGFDNWVNLNVLMSVSSTFETYLATIIEIALQSDPGVLLGSPKSVDGVFVLKHGSFDNLDYDSFIMSCTKGDWNSRINSYEKIFGSAPEELKSSIADLEAIRKLRNNIGHAFGRDIDDTRKHAVKRIIPVETLTRERVLKYQRTVRKVAKAIDKHLLFEHIGEFQLLNFYHSIYSELRQDLHIGERMIVLKKKVGQSGVQVTDKGYYRELVKFYENM